MEEISKVKKIVKKATKPKKVTNQQQAQRELDAIINELYDECIDLDVNNMLYFIEGKKEIYTNKSEQAKRELEKKYELEEFSLKKGTFEYDDILDNKSNEVNFTDVIDITDEIDLIENIFKATDKMEIDKLRKKIERAEKTLQKDKNKLEILLKRQLN